MSRINQSLEQKATNALRILNSSEFQHTFVEVRERLVNELENLELDGSDGAKALALVHKLQALLSIKAELVGNLRPFDREQEREQRREVEDVELDPNARTLGKVRDIKDPEVPPTA